VYSCYLNRDYDTYAANMMKDIIIDFIVIIVKIHEEYEKDERLKGERKERR
jgi:hypothetical protein